MEEKSKTEEPLVLDKYSVKDFAGEHHQNIPYEDYSFLSRLIDLVVRCDAQRGYDHVNVIWYLQSELAEKIGISRKKLRRGLRRLEELGYIFRIQTFGLENRHVTILKFPHWTKELALRCAKRSLSIWAKYKNHIAISAVKYALRKLGITKRWETTAPQNPAQDYERVEKPLSEKTALPFSEKSDQEHLILDPLVNTPEDPKVLCGGGILIEKQHEKIKPTTTTKFNWEVETLAEFLVKTSQRLELPFNARQCNDLAELHLERYLDTKKLREELYSKLDRPTLTPDSILRYARSDVNEMTARGCQRIPEPEQEPDPSEIFEFPEPDGFTRSTWSRALNVLANLVSPHVFCSWFKNISPGKITENVAELYVADEFFKEYIENKYISLLDHALEQVCETPVSAKIYIPALPGCYDTV